MNACYLFLSSGIRPEIVNSIKTFNGIIRLPKTEGVPQKKLEVRMDKTNPAKINAAGKIEKVYFKIYGGKKFSEENTFMVAAHPVMESNRIVILAPKRWPELEFQTVHGRPNASVAPGIMILDIMESITFKWQGKVYFIHNFAGEAVISENKHVAIAA